MYFSEVCTFLEACAHVVGSHAPETLRDVSVRLDASVNDTLWWMVIAHLLCKWKK